MKRMMVTSTCKNKDNATQKGDNVEKKMKHQGDAMQPTHIDKNKELE